MNKSNKTVGFRLSQSDWKQLANEANDFGLSPGAYARRLVVERLNDENARRLIEGVGMMVDRVDELRGDLATATVALLVHAGKSTNEEAEAFAKRALLR